MKKKLIYFTTGEVGATKPSLPVQHADKHACTTLTKTKPKVQFKQ